MHQTRTGQRRTAQYHLARWQRPDTREPRADHRLRLDAGKDDEPDTEKRRDVRVCRDGLPVVKDVEHPDTHQQRHDVPRRYPQVAVHDR
jgi:hypothetical protein